MIRLAMDIAACAIGVAVVVTACVLVLRALRAYEEESPE